MFITVGKILLKWALHNEEYEMAYLLYTEANIGIPVKFIYDIPSPKKFDSISSFMSGSENRGGNNRDLDSLLLLFSRSTYTKLPEWSNAYGYRFKK